MIIDDDETSLFLTRRMLTRLGIGPHIETASNGADGLSIIREASEKGQLPGMILLDVNMQGMGGLALLEELMKLKYINLIDTKVVLLTDSQDPRIIELARRHMAAAYISKPLTREKLLSVLD